MKDGIGKGWIRKPIIDIASISSGNSIPAKDRAGKYSASTTVGRHFISTKDVGFDGQINHVTDVAIPPEDQDNFKLAPQGATLVCSEGGSAGRKVGILKEDAHYGNKLFAITGEKEVLPQFVYYFCQSNDFVQQFKDRMTGMIGGVSLGKFKTIEVPVPPLDEQEKLVVVLEEAFEGLARARDHAEANLRNARELFTASLRALFSDNRENWPLRNIAEVCTEFGRGKSRHRPRNDPRLYGGDMPFVQTGDLSKADHFLREFSQTYSSEGVAQSKVWPKGTVCVAIVGATIGESAILEFDACFPDSVIGMIPEPSEADSEFLDFLLQFVKAELKEAGKGSARDNINLGTFSDRLFPIPDLKAQLEAVERISELDKECRRLSAEYSSKLKDLDDLRQSILQKAFAGELT